jgi:hypothetical protein
MDRGVVHANIDHYLALLTSQGLTARNRDTIIKLMIAEEDKLSHDLEQLEFAEDRTAKSRDRVNYFRRLRNAFAEGSTERVEADRMLANFEAIHHLLEQFCRQLRERVHSHRI